MRRVISLGAYVAVLSVSVVIDLVLQLKDRR